MPGSQGINSIAVREAIQDDLDFMIDGLTKVHELILKTPQINTVYKKSEGLADLKKSTEEMAASNQKLMDMQKQLEGSLQRVAALEKKLAEERERASRKSQEGMSAEEKAKERLAQSTSKQAKELAFINAQTAENNRQLKLRAELENAVAGSIEEARIKVKLLTDQRNILNLSTEAGRKKQAELNEEIDRYNEFIKQNVDALSKQKINIGNYEGSAKIIVDALKEVETKLESLREKQQQLTNVQQQAARGVIGFKFGQQEAEELKQVNAQLSVTQQQFTALSNITSDKQFFNVASKIGDAKVEVRGFTTTLIELERQGLGNSKFAIELRGRLAELTDEIADTRDEIKALSSDTRSFDLFASSVGTASSIFQTAAASAEIFGENTEEVNKSIQRLIAIQTISNGVREIANDLTTRGTAANKVYAFIQGLVATAMDKSAASAVRLNAALGLLGIAVTVIGAIVIGMSMLKKSTEEVIQKQSKLNEVYADAKTAYVNAMTQVRNLNEQVRLAKDGFIDKDKVVKEYNETLGKTIGKAKDLDDVEQLLAKNAKAYIEFTLLKAAANIALQKAAEKAFEAQEFDIKVKDVKPGKNAEANKQVQNIFKGYKESVKNEQADFNKIAENFFNQAAELSKKFNFNFSGRDDKDDKPKSTLSDQYKLDDQTRKALFEADKQRMLDQMAIAKQVADDEKTSFDVRLSAAQFYYNTKRRMIEAQKDFDTTDINLKEAEDIKLAEQEKKGAEVISKIKENASAQRKLVAAKSNSELLQLDMDMQKQGIDMTTKYFDDVKKLREEKAAEQESHTKSLHEIELEELANAYQAEINQIEASYAKKRSHTEKEEKDYQKAKLDALERFQVASLKADIEFTKETIALAEARAKASGKQEDIDAVQAAKTKLAGLELKLAATITQFKIDQNNREDKSDDELMNRKLARLEKYASYARQIEDVIGGFVQNSIDRQKNALQEKEDRLNANYEAEVQRINDSTLAESEKADRLKMIEANKMAQTEQIERRRRQLDLERAKFDKAANIANIISETGLAVMRALADKTVPFPVRVGYSIAAGAIGAVNLVKAISAPLPKFATGTDSSPEGWALTDEEGPEMYIEPDGKTYMGSDEGPTLRYLKGGTQIIPYDQVNQMMLNLMLQKTAHHLQPKDNMDQLLKKQTELAVWQTEELKKAYTKQKSSTTVINKIDLGWSNYLKKNVYD